MTAVAAATAARGGWEGEIFRSTAAGRELSVTARMALRRGPDGTPVEIGERARAAYDASAAEIEAHRYLSIFHAIAAAFRDLDFSRVRKAIGGLAASGVADIVGHLGERTDFIDAAIEMVSVLDVNDKAVELFGAARAEFLARLIGWAWPRDSRHVFAQPQIAATRRDDSCSAETVLKAFDRRRLDVLFTVCWPSGHKTKGAVLVDVIDMTERKRGGGAEAQRTALPPIVLGHGRRLLEADMDRVDDLLDALRAEGVTDLGAHLARFPGLIEMLGGLRRAGVANLGGNLDARPDFVARCLEAATAQEVNAATVRLCGGRDPADFAGAFVLRCWPAIPARSGARSKPAGSPAAIMRRRRGCWRSTAASWRSPSRSATRPACRSGGSPSSPPSTFRPPPGLGAAAPGPGRVLSCRPGFDARRTDRLDRP